VLLRAFAVLAAIAIPLLLTIDLVAAPLRGFAWLGPALAIAAALPIVWVAKHARGQALVGAALAGMAAAASPQLPRLLALTGDPEALPILDLREGPVPAELGDYAQVRGFLRSEWQVDEYRVAAGERPDQNEVASAVLVPLLGSDAAVIEVGADQLGRVIVARVDPERLAIPGVVTLRGRLGPVAPEIVDSLFAVQVAADGQATATHLRPDAVLLDTLELPTRAQAITRLALVLAAAALALVLLLLALPRDPVKPPE
jgi:hypothetical protein